MILLFAQIVLGGGAPRTTRNPAPGDTVPVPSRADAIRPDTSARPPFVTPSRREARRQAREEARRREAFNALPQEEKDSLFSAQVDSLVAQKADSPGAARPDSLAADTLRRDSVKTPRPAGAFLDDPITGKNTDSLVYDVRNKLVYIYNKGDVTYQNSNLKADYMRIDMDSKMVYAYGKPDTLDGKDIVTKPEFTEGSATYQMDTITYNLDSKKAKIKGVATQQGDGWLVGGSVKKMPDNTINIEHGKYTTCDHTDHPHFYLAKTKAKVIPGNKVVTGPAYLVMEDVPIYFLGIPEGFFPINMGPKSGLLMPTYGEEYSKGFFLRDLGYYFTLGEYADLAVRGGIYTLGSWEASAASRYIKRYKYSGSFNMQYSNVKTGEKGEDDYIKQSNFRIQWTHSQDPKANPGSTFSASVNFATSGYSRYSATNLNDILSTQTNSTVSYSKNWAGTPFSLSANMAISQNSQNKTISITLDGETISRATVNTVIAGGKGEITGNFTADEAKNLATLILSGALPLNLTQLEVSAISATLGVEALDRAIQAGIIGVALVMLFMLFRYRLCGLVADIALTIYIMIVVLLLALTGAQLTLPGVAGIILGIGMAVDANVVIFERIVE